jgi:transcriptional regulator with XRE-family HTH domain/quercetin dioxygenase-like cupin family protein
MPVYSSHLLDYDEWAVGARIRRERQAQRLTLRDLSDQVGVSVAHLSKLETDKAIADLSLLAKIAGAMKVPLGALLPARSEHHFLVTRREQLASEQPMPRELVGPGPGPRQHHNPVWPLSERFVGKHMDPVLAEIHPLSEKDLHFIAHDHEEFMFVTEGAVESLLKTDNGLVVEQLEAGDCMYFNSYLPHCHRSATSNPARTLNVMYSMRGAIDSDDRELGPSSHQFFRRGAHSDLTREVAERIALLRRSRGLTLSELSKSVGTSPNNLAEIEKGERPVPLDLLLKLARKFRRPIEHFFASILEDRPSHTVQRKETVLGEGNRENGGVGDVCRALVEGFPDRGIHPYYIRLANGESQLVQTEHHGQKFIYVLAGEVEFVSSEGNHSGDLLRAGDALFLDSSVPHRITGRAHSPYATMSAEMLAVFWSPLGAEYLSGKVLASGQPTPGKRSL